MRNTVCVCVCGVMVCVCVAHLCGILAVKTPIIVSKRRLTFEAVLGGSQEKARPLGMLWPCCVACVAKCWADLHRFLRVSRILSKIILSL